MTGKLPEAFLERMKRQLGEQFPAFLATYEQPRHYGLRLNGLKDDEQRLLARLPFSSRKIDWAQSGYYFDEADKPGRHPYYHAGLYYIQEPSAMAPAELLDVQPGDLCLDLCAAPGGKSTQIAAKLRGEGLLVSNDQSAERTKALVKNLELFGVRNAVVLNESPHRLSKRLVGFFNKILVDAPCSGEGMFRKDEQMWREWSEQSIVRCCAMQRDILRHAAVMLTEGGTLVYSTCTFAPAENEQMIIDFLSEYPQFEMIDCPVFAGFAKGQLPSPEYTFEQQTLAARTVRLWPHLLEGEGHFVAKLRKKMTTPAATETGSERVALQKSGSTIRVHSYAEMHRFFAEQTLLDWRRRSFMSYGDHVYACSDHLPDLTGLKVVRPGLYVGMNKKNRFEPGHALALALRAEDVRCSLSFSLDDERLARYLRGETLEVPAEQLHAPDVTDDLLRAGKWYVLICVDGYSLGWGKWQAGVLKNEYPQTWRRLS